VTVPGGSAATPAFYLVNANVVLSNTTSASLTGGCYFRLTSTSGTSNPNLITYVSVPADGTGTPTFAHAAMVYPLTLTSDELTSVAVECFGAPMSGGSISALRVTGR